MLRIIGHIFTFIYFLAIFASTLFPASVVLTAEILGIIAFAIFALLLARGLTYTENIFKYFLRLTMTAFLTELVLGLAEHFLGINFVSLNPVFSYAAALGFIVGLTMMVSSSYLLLMRLETTDGTPGNKRPFQRSIQMASYNLPPWIGIALGLACMLLSLYTSWRMNFVFSIYGVLLTAAFYLGLIEPHKSADEEDDFVHRSILAKLARRSVFGDEKKLLRSLMYVFSFNLVFYMIELLVDANNANPKKLFTLLAFIPALLPAHPAGGKKLKWRILRYSILPLSLILLSLLRYLLVL